METIQGYQYEHLYPTPPQPWNPKTGFTANNLFVLKKVAGVLHIPCSEPSINMDPKMQLDLCEAVIHHAKFPKIVNIDQIDIVLGMARAAGLDIEVNAAKRRTKDWRRKSLDS